MKREFLHALSFDEIWKSLGLTDEDLRALESMILQHPDMGEVIQGTGGLRKVRFGIDNRGKSRGILYM